jgi:hypothetical protein
MSNRDEPLQESDRAGHRDPAVVPSISSEQMPFTEGIGIAAYSPRAQEANADNDQGSHTSPPDNDGETVPEDEVVDQVGG